MTIFVRHEGPVRGPIFMNQFVKCVVGRLFRTPHQDSWPLSALVKLCSNCPSICSVCQARHVWPCAGKSRGKMVVMGRNAGKTCSEEEITVSKYNNVNKTDALKTERRV